MKRAVFDKRTQSYIKKAMKQGATISTIAKGLGMSPYLVRKAMAAVGLEVKKGPKRCMPKNEELNLCRDYLSHRAAKQTAEKYGVSTQTVLKILKHYGVSVSRGRQNVAQ